MSCVLTSPHVDVDALEERIDVESHLDASFSSWRCRRSWSLGDLALELSLELEDMFRRLASVSMSSISLDKLWSTVASILWRRLLELDGP